MTRPTALRRRARAALLALVLAMTLVPAATAHAAEGTAVLGGHVDLDVEHSGLSGVTAYVIPLDPDDVVRSAPVFDDRWQVEGLPAGRYKVLFHDLIQYTSSPSAYTWHGSGASALDAEIITLGAGGRRTDLETYVPRGARIQGTFPEDVSGRFTVQVKTGPERWEDARSIANPSGPSPFYQGWYVEGLPPGTYRLYYERGTREVASGWLGGGDAASTASEITVAEGAVKDVGLFTPRAAGRITGVVRDSAGNPVVGAEITVRGRNDPYGEWTARSNRKGRYTVAGLDTDQYYAEISAKAPFARAFSGGVFEPLPPEPPRSSFVAVRAARTTSLPLEVRRESTVRGRVTDDRGLPAAGVRVRMEPRVPTPGTRVAEATTRADGTYDITVPGPYETTISFTDPRGRFATEFHADAPTADGSTPVALTSEGTTVVDASLSPLAVTLDRAAVSYGHVVRASIERIDAEAYARGSWAWFRTDGVAVVGPGTSSTYSPQASEMGARFYARFTPRAGGSPTSPAIDSQPTDPVEAATTDLRVVATALGGRQVRITATATSPSAYPALLDAKVVASIVRPGDDRTRTLTMVDGTVTYVLTNQPLGRQTYYADLLATPGLLPDRSPQSVVTVR